tara:strand:- start:349 stop:678 length:330 start_codon:yes stop_codon:yes gene_type:complete
MGGDYGFKVTPTLLLHGAVDVCKDIAGVNGVFHAGAVAPPGGAQAGLDHGFGYFDIAHFSSGLIDPTFRVFRLTERLQCLQSRLPFHADSNILEHLRHLRRALSSGMSD